MTYLTMEPKKKRAIADFFENIQDPRIERTKQHKLIDIITIAICAVICGAETWIAIETYGKAKKEWLKQFLELQNGIPSHDTFARLFARINPKEFQQCFLEWIKSVAQIINGEVIAIDGKNLKRSYNKKSSKRAINMISAWAVSNRLVMGQLKVNDKSNEIAKSLRVRVSRRKTFQDTAIPELINVLDISGCIVTIDAIGCQKEIVKTIVQKEGDYVVALKSNQGNLHRNVENLFKEAISKRCQGFKASSYSTREFGYGRE